MDTHLNEGNQLADDQPDVKHLEVGGVGEDLPHVDDDRRQHQHRRQVHPQGRFKERRFEEHGNISWKKLLLRELQKQKSFLQNSANIYNLNIYKYICLDFKLFCILQPKFPLYDFLAQTFSNYAWWRK